VILVDSNVIIDVIEGDPRWATWSSARLADAGVNRQGFINEIVIAEVAPTMGPLSAFYETIEQLGIGFEQVSHEAAYLSGTAFLEYRKKRLGAKSVIADFLIGGHAQVLGAAILTRDPRFYRAYFPTVPLIAPENEEND
jgi:predicted nucleic acid-binding protein